MSWWRSGAVSSAGSDLPIAGMSAQIPPRALTADEAATWIDEGSAPLPAREVSRKFGHWIAAEATALLKASDEVDSGGRAVCVISDCGAAGRLCGVLYSVDRSLRKGEGER